MLVIADWETWYSCSERAVQPQKIDLSKPMQRSNRMLLQPYSQFQQQPQALLWRELCVQLPKMISVYAELGKRDTKAKRKTPNYQLLDCTAW